MNPISLKIKTHEIQCCWDSWEWLFRQDLERIDARARKMYQEMQAAGIPKYMIDPFVAEQFRELCENVAQLTSKAKEAKPMTPVPRKDKDKEARAASPGDVTVRQLTPEERERLDALPKHRYTDRHGGRLRAPVIPGSTMYRSSDEVFKRR